MKTLGKVLLASILAVGLVQAKDKDFSASIETAETLKIGENQVSVSIKSKTIPVYNADVKLKVYQVNKKIISYKTNKVNEEGNYTFNINLPESGKYNYLLSYNRMGGVIHKVRGDWEVK